MFDKLFGEFTFEEIDASIPGCTPDLHVTQNGITFTRRLIGDMGYPPYVRALLDKTNRAFALQVCRSDSDCAMHFSKPKGEQKMALQLHSTAMRHSLRRLMGDEWQDTHRYYMTGTWYENEKAMIFDMNVAKELPPFKPLNPGVPKKKKR